MGEVTGQEWQTFLSDFPDAHILQTLEWGRLKANFGWKPAWFVGEEAGAQVLFRKLPLGLSIAYIPKGPVGKNWFSLLPDIEEYCKKERSIYLKIEPDLFIGDVSRAPSVSAYDEYFMLNNYTLSQESIQPPRTILVDLRGNEGEILSRMRQKTRYNIRLAERKGVEVCSSNNISEFYRLLKETAHRDGFGVHEENYYQSACQLFHSTGRCEIFLASVEQEVVAGIMVFRQGVRAWYFYGASSDRHREKMPTHLLQWRAILWAKESGCLEYDLWGIPDEEEDELERSFQTHSEGLWGVYRFKRGFGGKVVRSAGPWDKIFNPDIYRFYKMWKHLKGGLS
jgi:lipid II:glycine glycyltransferase (peptidoglycan interpeptide bridge formation enzyme)